MAHIRSASVKFLTESLVAGAGVSHSSEGESLGKQIEQAIFNTCSGSTDNLYRDTVRQKGLALKKDNPELAQRICSGDLPPEEFAKMQKEEMKSQDLKQQDGHLREQSQCLLSMLACTGPPDVQNTDIRFVRTDLQASLVTSDTAVASGIGAVPLEATADGLEMRMSAQQEARLETWGENEVGENAEGEFKARAQPHVGEAMKGVEFDTGDAV